MFVYALTIFLSAFLIFQVQPLIAKFILPWFGGAPAVWTTSLLFFQVFLLLGYAYAHLIVRRLKLRHQLILHLVVLLVSVIQLPIIPAELGQMSDALGPALRIILLLSTTLGLPYVILSASAPLIQAWFNEAHPGASPYRLYALSNVGSLLGLLTFPFLFEPLLTRVTGAVIWSVAFGLYIVMCVVTMFVTWRSLPDSDAALAADQPNVNSPSITDRLLWLGLSAAAVVLLLSFTNQLTLNVPPVPFLWVVPFSLYLLTFIIAFDRERWYLRGPVHMAVLPSVMAVVAIVIISFNASFIAQLITYNLTLFVLCLFCHGELARLRPDPAHLTAFYLTIALGGALGGLFVALLAPALFDDLYETFIGLALILVLVWVITRRDRAITDPRVQPIWSILSSMTVIVTLFGITFQYFLDSALVQTRVRNFYGVFTVVEEDRGRDAGLRWLYSGAIAHGVQQTGQGGVQKIAYYAPESGVSQALEYYAGQPRHIGIIGLGTGALAAYGEASDTIRFYEINPQVDVLAREWFTYLADTPAQVEVVIDDGRLALASEPSQNYDLLIVDAFTGDSIPVHLLTDEAFALYLDHLAPDGALVIHISNLHIDLAPVVMAAADHHDLRAVRIFNDPDPSRTIFPSDWVVLSRDDSLIDALAADAYLEPVEQDRVRLWTDDYTSILPLLR